MQRFYVGGISSSTSEEDLRAMFAKVCHVEEVHLPQPFAFGLQRPFAIVRLSEIDPKAESALKRLDGTNWKGSKLKIEKAKEYYRDRFEAERANAHLAPIKPQQPVSKARTQPILSFAADVIKLRRRKGVPALKAATKPYLTFHDKTYGASCTAQAKACRRTVFDDNDAENFIAENNLVSIDVTGAPSSSSRQPQATVQKNTEAAVKVIAKGGGQRKGFGTLLLATLPSEPPPPPSTHNKPAVKNDDMYELADFEEGPGKEMSEEELLEDRQRMLRMALMFTGDNKSQPISQPPLTTKDEKKAAKRKTIDEVTIVDEKASKKRKIDDKQKPDIQLSPPFVAPFATADVESIADNTEEQFSSGFAQMNSLKSIFAKQQGGIWWNDEGKVTSNAREERGVEYLDDIIFQEAERYGLDVRSSMDDARPTTAMTRANKDEPKSMLFSFFSEEENPSAGNETAIKPKEKEAPKLKPRQQQPKPESPVITPKLPSQLLITDRMEEMVNNAKRFQRDRSVDEIQQEWQENNKQLMTIMKKKTRIMAKRAEEQRSSHGYYNQGNKRQKQQEK